ncbi:uncharacterized protein OCT59_009057 [Rhizophagus irregularis]|uniref:Uncharacterized protein n=2 Tax=Rhizophagus irregularis TaxID=588596 RepID=U9V5L3_RHIID|nr:hypothetical protein GLOIN_2v1775726 [Rhizophagus irregularis DAOM 181602=DAOM 197198]EXX59070.1 hypothetical protein RirG_192050 [Rhizophagus irregularis DAOM 197198w]POG70592.1 hypothetical protein GLOIN_2v1775726 [Rhizophagus irregularis DAOM 181602=DAOM 197198]UZO17716.1 hypothetical protein OCT59_009057 [Rhizophagus irregularis]GBC24396.1 hypothetical protein GLOIN_2v1775726 [Rhizophagus irregularis DAOM 181602=DAOM 197198]|eukprot:XP_025177458.1 hypothetical protein GLOIN_2v1775726 [Rhizophagus irregularis DAOM 181602=DAOM 197198]
MSDIGSVQMITLQPIQYQLVELSLFYQPQKDNNIYHITCKKITQDHLQGTGNSDDSYDYKFFIESLDDFTTTFHVTCTKLLPNSLILNILNKKFYGFDFDVTELGRRHLLTLHQKLNFERNLRQNSSLVLFNIQSLIVKRYLFQ